MSMDKPALQLIQDTAKAAMALPDSVPHVVALPDSVSLHSLEQYLPVRTRFRASMATESIDNYVRYIQSRNMTNLECFVNQGAMSAKIIFDKGTVDSPQHGGDTASLKLKATAQLTAMSNVCNNRMSQKELAEWLQDWREYLTPIVQEGQDPMNIKQAIQSVRTVSIEEKSTSDHSDKDFGKSRSSMDEINAKSKHGELPAGFTFSCIPYTGLGVHSFMLRLSMITDRNDPKFVLRWPLMDSDTEDMAEEFREILEGKMGEMDVTTYVGTLSL